MTPAQFRAGLAKLGISNNDFARIVGINARNVARYCVDGGEGPSPPVAFALNSLLRNHIPPPPDTEGAIRSVKTRLAALREDVSRAGWNADELDIPRKG